MADFGQEMRKLRTNACISLKTVSACIGLSVTYISQIERGDRPPPKRSIVRLWLQVFKCPRKKAAELLRLADLPRVVAIKLDPSRVLANDVLRRLAKCYADDSLKPVVWLKISKLLSERAGIKRV